MDASSHIPQPDPLPAAGQLCLDRALSRAREQFTDMPGLRLTVAQASRLWSLDRAACETLLTLLVAERFLTRVADSGFARAD